MNNIKSILKRLANRLRKRAGKFTAFQQKLLFIFFMMPAALYCSYLIFGNGKDQTLISNIKMPLISSGKSDSQLKREIDSINKILGNSPPAKDGSQIPETIYQKQSGILDSIIIPKRKLL